MGKIIMTSINILVAILAIVASIVSIYLNYKVNVKLSQYNTINEIQRETAEVSHKLKILADELVTKYGLDKVNKRDIPEEDRQRINEITSNINLLLKKMFITMPDEQYDLIKTSIDTEKPMQLQDLEENLLKAMRSTQIPDTKEDKKDIRYIKEIK